MDQGRQECGQMGSPVLSLLCGQPGAVATVRAGLQPGQFPASDGAVVIQLLVEFLGPPLVAAANGQPFREAWKANRWSK